MIFDTYYITVHVGHDHLLTIDIILTIERESVHQYDCQAPRLYNCINGSIDEYKDGLYRHKERHFCVYCV